MSRFTYSSAKLNYRNSYGVSGHPSKTNYTNIIKAKIATSRQNCRTDLVEMWNRRRLKNSTIFFPKYTQANRGKKLIKNTNIFILSSLLQNLNLKLFFAQTLVSQLYIFPTLYLLHKF